jgi:hypothetical protein
METVLNTLGLPEEVLAELAELDGSTNERMEAEQGRREGISIQELVFGVPEATIINAAFSHAGLGVGRFHSPDRGAWYAGFNTVTSIFNFPHRAFLADFAGEFHRLVPGDQECLAPDPVPACYGYPRAMARTLLNGGSLGLVYPSVRHPGGLVIACFRPALVFNVRRGELVIVQVNL